MTRLYSMRIVPHDPNTDAVHSVVDSTKQQDAAALWSALPPDLRLALAKTAPRVAMVKRWISGRGFDVTADGYSGILARATRSHVDDNGHVTGGWLWFAFGERQDTYATDGAAALEAVREVILAQGYVLDGDAP